MGIQNRILLSVDLIQILSPSVRIAKIIQQFVPSFFWFTRVIDAAFFYLNSSISPSANEKLDSVALSKSYFASRKQSNITGENVPHSPVRIMRIASSTARAFDS